jgi:hypothetical protein
MWPSFHVSLLPSILPSVCVYDIDILKTIGLSLCSLSFIWVCLVTPGEWFQVVHFWQADPRSLFSHWFPAGDISSDDLARVISARLPTFPFVIIILLLCGCTRVAIYSPREGLELQ